MLGAWLYNRRWQRVCVRCRAIKSVTEMMEPRQPHSLVHSSGLVLPEVVDPPAPLAQLPPHLAKDMHSAKRDERSGR